MGSPADWYKTFLNNSTVQCLFEENVSRSTSCYALQLSQLDFKELPNGSSFELHLFFYDIVKKQFFGRQWISNVQVSNGQDSLKFNQTIFFHTNISDERVVLVCEVVKKEKDPWVFGFTIIPIYSKNQPIVDYSTNNSGQFLGKRLQIYKGGCKCLLYTGIPLDSNKALEKQQAILVCSLQTHEKMMSVIDYIPEFFIVGNNDQIAGLQPSNFGQLANPELAPIFTAILDNIQVSYTVNSSQVDAAILEAMNRERCYKANLPSNDPTIPKLAIIERRLRIGIHNGFCYVEEPLYLLLSDSEPFGRRRSRSLSRISKNSVQTSDYFNARSSARLKKLCADERFAIVFAIDYLIGVGKNEDYVTDAQLVMICWNAWCPYKNGSFTLADTINVPLVGGCRPNPDDVLCFKNLLTLNDMTTSTLNRIDPKIHLRFNFAIVESSDNQTLLQLPNRMDSKSRIENDVTPQPRPDITAHIEPEQIDLSNSIEIKDSIVVPLNEARSQTKIHKSKSVPVLNSAAENSYQEDEIDVGEILAPRVSGFSRSIASFLSSVEFPQILNRSGKQAPFGELSTTRPINMELEVNTRLDTHEIVVQFLAISTFKNAYISNLSRNVRYFFTLRFYRFEPIATEMLLAHPRAEWKRNDPVVFQRLDENGRLVEPQSNGFMVKFTVERCSMHANDSADFANYLLNANLCIDVWNADTLMHCGCSNLPLKSILRQGSDSVQLNVQCPIVQSGFPLTESTTTGLLFLRVGNIGHPSHNQLDVYDSRNKAAIISHRLSRLNRNGPVNQRARPLSAIHESALQRFLNTQKLDIQQRKEEVFGNESIYRLQKWDELKKQINPAMAKASLKRFIFEEELEAYKMLRNESKASQLLKAVFKSITVNYAIYAKAGQVEFFEYALKNTFAEPIICLIDSNDPRLSVITNADEWKFFKEAKNMRSPVERDLFHIENNGMLSLYLNAMETVNIPFKYDPFYNNQTNQSFEIKTIFKRSDTEEPLSILELLVQGRGHSIENSFRWFAEENSRCVKLLRVHGIQGNKRVLALRSTDPNVLCSLRNAPNGGQELLVTCYAPESPFCREFIIMMYSDRYHYNQLASWGFALHGMHKLNVDAIQAQTSKIPLILRQPADINAMISFHTSSECVVIAPTSDPITNNSQTLNEIKAVLIPNFSGRRSILITAVDANLRKLLNAWILFTNVQEPNIVKTYEIEIPLSQQTAIVKNITIENPYTIDRNYRIHTSNTQLVSIENEYLRLEKGEKTTIGLIFYPISANRPTTTNVLIFVENATNGQQEEAYSLHIKYTN